MSLLTAACIPLTRRCTPTPTEILVSYCQATSASSAHAFAIRCVLYPVSAALASSFRMDSISTSYQPLQSYTREREREGWCVCVCVTYRESQRERESQGEREGGREREGKRGPWRVYRGVVGDSRVHRRCRHRPCHANRCQIESQGERDCLPLSLTLSQPSSALPWKESQRERVRQRETPSLCPPLTLSLTLSLFEFR